MAQIPITKDVSDLIGCAAERVENRSLMLDKFSFHKRWPTFLDETGKETKWDEASRWSFMRIAEGARQLLSKEASSKRARANGRNVQPETRQRLIEDAQTADSLANISWDTADLAKLRAKHTRRFLGLFRGAFSNRATVTIGQLEGRLAINLADSLIQNAGISLDRLFGLPFIPGSAIKGICRHTALEELKIVQPIQQKQRFELFKAVFGTSEGEFESDEFRPFRKFISNKLENQKGAVAFLPAYPVNEARIVVDISNVHYPDYYRSQRIEDLSKESPQPNPFPAVEIGGQFAFCLFLNRLDSDPALLAAATRWLEEALVVRGLGAKTAAGYGWFSLRPDLTTQLLAEERMEAEAAEQQAIARLEKITRDVAEASRLAALPPELKAKELFSAMNQQDFATAASEIASLKPEEQMGLLLALLMPSRSETWKNWKKSDKPANKTRVEALRTAARSFKVNLS